MLIMHTSRIRTARSQKLLRGLSCPILEEVDPFPVSAVCSGTFASCQGETRNISKASFNQRGRIFTLSMHVAYIEQPGWRVITIVITRIFWSIRVAHGAIEPKWRVMKSISVHNDHLASQEPACFGPRVQLRRHDYHGGVQMPGLRIATREFFPFGKTNSTCQKGNINHH